MIIPRMSESESATIDDYLSAIEQDALGKLEILVLAVPQRLFLPCLIKK